MTRGKRKPKFKCAYCGKDFTRYDSVFCEEHDPYDSRPFELTIEQNIQVLKNLRKFILENDPECYNSDVVGDNCNECSWGMCNERKEVWDKPEYHSWPYEFETKDRIAPLDNPIRCHFDKGDPNDPEWTHGCFYRCIAFMKGVPSREETIAMIDRIIQKHELQE
jgi:hypothetical protein